MSATFIKDTLASSAETISYSKVRKLADQFDDELTGSNCMPDDYFKLICDILSDEVFFNKQGSYWFVFHLQGNDYKISAEQGLRIVDIIQDNYLKYQNADFCLYVCDFVARFYKADVSLDFFSKIRKEKLKEFSRTAILAGLEVILHHEDDNTSAFLRAKKIYLQVARIAPIGEA